MKKVWMIHNSLYGNSEKITNQIAEILKSDYDIRVNHIKNVNLEDIVDEELYGLIIAVRIVAFSSDREMKAFLKKLDKVITHPVSKVAYFSTHALKWRKFFIRGIKKTLKKIGCVGDVCPEFLEIRMQTAEGPVEEGSDIKIQHYISTLQQFLK